MYILQSPLAGEAINLKSIKPERNILAEAQVNLNDAWKPMGKFLAHSATGVSQLFVYKTPFDLWLRNR